MKSIVLFGIVVIALTVNFQCYRGSDSGEPPPIDPSPTPPIGNVGNLALDSPIVFKGTYSNIKTDGEHQWGYSVSLWKQGEEYRGIASGSNDLLPIGSPPTGVLEDLRYDRESHAMSFRVSLMLEDPESGKKSRTVETMDFNGNLKGSSLVGKAVTIAGLCGPSCSRTIEVALRYSKEMSSRERDFADSKEWNAFVDKVRNR